MALVLNSMQTTCEACGFVDTEATTTFCVECGYDEVSIDIPPKGARKNPSLVSVPNGSYSRQLQVICQCL